MIHLLSFLLLTSVFAIEHTPTQRVMQSLAFTDDMDLVNLKTAIQRQIKAYGEQDLTGVVQYGPHQFNKRFLVKSLQHFEKVTDEATECLKVGTKAACFAELSIKLNRDFYIYKPIPKKTENGYKTKQTYFTSYYTPDLEGSYTQTAEYKNPIYALPATEAEQKLTRVQIDYDGKLRGKGLEILWVKNTLFDIYFMHIQGGGRVRLPDGKTIYLSFDGKNGHKFQFVSNYLISSGLMQREEVNYWSQEEFLETHPELQRTVYSTCPMFIYFKITAEEPHGLWSIPLTEGRSLAIDSTIYKTLGVVSFVKTLKTTSTDASGKPVKSAFSRFFLAQDTGSAIRGNARVDLYWGYGEDALRVASKLLELGDQYFLIKKPASGYSDF